jgi:hypothetical protein
MNLPHPTRARRRRALSAAALLLLALLTTGCLEQLSTARIPEGAARNFLYYLAHNEQDDANAYWAPQHAPADSRAQVAAAVAAVRSYDITVVKSDSARQADGAMEVTLIGKAHKPSEPAPATDAPVLRARLIEIGPGWRITEFHLLCCGAS